GNDGTLSGAVAFRPGMSSLAFTFDGSTGYVDAGSPSNLNFGTGAFSVSYWMKRGCVSCGAQGWAQGLVQKYSPSASAGWYMYLGPESWGSQYANKIVFVTRQSADISNGFSSNTVFADTDQWHHIVATRSASGDMNLYVDGSLDTSIQGSPLDVSS